MSRSLRFVIAVCVAMPITTSTELSRSHDTAAAQGDRERFVGAWRLVSLEHTGPGGAIEKPDCTGQFVFTADGHAAVQVMYRNQGAGHTAYAQGGYEATFGRYTVDDKARTFTFHVDGALVRTLVGQDLRRTYTFAGNELIVEPSNKDERWRVVWTRE